MTVAAPKARPAPQTTTVARILIVDDDLIILDSLGEFLRHSGFAVEVASSFASALKILADRSVDVVLADVNIPGGNGFELLHLLRKKHPDVAVMMMTAYGTIESAVEAIKMGAYDYLTKPIIDDELSVCIERALCQQAILRENKTLKEQLGARYGLDAMIGQDYRMARVFDLVESVAATKATVLIQGASGTGKSLLAHVIHRQSPRKDKPFIEVSCGAMPEPLLESELFGHTRGAFTGAVANKAGKFKAAHGGTIFLDEIAAASPSLQVKLLRVLQAQQFEPVGSNKTETVDARVILASNRDLEQEMRAGRFREDLFYRVNVITIELPPLQERLSDIVQLAKHFLGRFAAEMGRHVLTFSEEALMTLQRYSWPGNVRELENAVHRAVVLCKGSLIQMEDLPPKVIHPPKAQADEGTYIPVSLRQALEGPEKRIIAQALRANNWNRQATAVQLDINRTTLYKKMKRYDLDRVPGAS